MRWALGLLLGLGLAAESEAGFVHLTDGNPNEWVGAPSTVPHTDADVGSEWIYTGLAGDRRTGAGTSSDADLTEVRIANSATVLYLLFRLQDIVDPNEVHIALGFDRDQVGSDTAHPELGDESNLSYGRGFLRPERVLSLHMGAGGVPKVEWYDGGTWYSIAGSQIAISAANDVVEAEVPLADLAGLTSTGDFVLSVATFQNNPGDNELGDSTDDLAVSDAIDVMSIPGQSGSAEVRDLGDGNVYFGWWIRLQGNGPAPTAVVWDRLYHSQCDKLIANQCPGGDHPVDQVVPGLGGGFPDPQGDGVTFLNLRRWSEDGTPAPGGSTDVYAFDDESADLYLLTHKGDVTDTANAPVIRYFASSEQFVDLADVGDYTGGWGGSGSTTYDVFLGTIPAQAPGDVFYYFRVQDGSGNRHLCRDDGDVLSWIGQWIREADCQPNHDYAYSVLDDDITGPSIADVMYDAGQICASVSDTNSRSGDNDSGIEQVLVRYDSVLTNVSGGAGSMLPMNSGGGSTYCATVGFTDPTYYRVEAVNGDFDNTRSEDRDGSLSSIRCQGASCGGAGASQNNDIWWSEVLHDTRDLDYRTPFGALATGTPLTLRLRVAAGDLTATELQLYTPGGTQLYAGTPVSEPDVDYDLYEFSVPGSAFTAPGIYAYKLKLTDGTDVDWYIDDHAHNHYDHEDRFENGTGIMVDDGLASLYFDNSFKITVYDADFTTPDWAKNATMYQILPDRFRNGDLANDANWPFPDVYGTPAYYHSLQSAWNEPVNDPREAGPFFQQWSADFFGGDLQGILDKLGYFQSIGVTALYLNPIFAAPSNHGYDTSDYLQVNPRFGDNALFETLAAEAEERGIKIVLDGVFNHTGSDSSYFDRPRHWPDSGACEAAASPFATFFTFFGTAGPCYDGKNYDSWFGFDTLPLLNENDAVKDFIFDKLGDEGTAVIQQWYELGADGWRFDVADEISHQFWQEFRLRAKAANEGPLYSEVWYEATPWLAGDQMDATMNYRYRKAVLGFLVDTDFTDNDNDSDRTIWSLAPSQLDYALRSIQEDYPPQAFAVMMNLMGSHDTNRALFVLRERSVDLASALDKMKMMAALQLTYPGAPTIYYGDEAGIGARDYAGEGKWGAGKNASGILQDDPYNRHPYPWTDETGSIPAGLPNASLLEAYRILGLTRRHYYVLRTGQVVTLLADDQTEVYAYARVDADEPDCAIAIFNRSTGVRNVTLDVLPAVCGGTFEDVLDGGADWTVSGSSLTVTGLPGLGSAVLVQAFDNPGTPDTVAALPPAEIQASRLAADLPLGGSTTVQAVVHDVAGQPMPAGVTVTFEILAGGGNFGGGGSTASTLTDASGTANITYTAPGSSATAVVEASIVDPSGVKLCSTVALYVALGSNVADSLSVCTTVGTQTVDALAGLNVAATKRGLAEPALSLARFAGNPHAGVGQVRSPFVGVRLSSDVEVDSLALRVRYTDETTEASHRLFWWNGSSWLQVVSATVSTSANELRFTADPSTAPSLAQLTGGAFVVSSGDPGTTATPTVTATATSTSTLPPTATLTRTFTPTPMVVCTPPSCPGGVLVCPGVCPGGCGTICVTFTPTATATLDPAATSTATPTQTRTLTASPSPTVTATATRTATPSRTATLVSTATSTRTSTVGPSPTATRTSTGTTQPTPTGTAAATGTATGTAAGPSATATSTGAAGLPSPTFTLTTTASPLSPTATRTPGATLGVTGSPLAPTALVLLVLLFGGRATRAVASFAGWQPGKRKAP